MKGKEAIAADVLQCVLSWEREARIIGNVTAEEIAVLIHDVFTSCPKAPSPGSTRLPGVQSHVGAVP
jgi:hypothetical protein